VSVRPSAGLMAAALAVPLVLLCCLGPAALASLLAGFVAWVGGFNIAVVTAVTLVGGLVTYGFLRRRTVRLRRVERS
jgi:hypothetical protein